MPSAVTPLSVGLRVAVHALIGGLTAWVVVAALTAPGPTTLATVVVALVFVALYAVGVALAGPTASAPPRVVALLSIAWIGALCLAWLCLVWWSAEAAYLVFPLFFLFLAVLPGWRGYVAVLCGTVLLVVLVAERQGWSVGGVAGPIVGAVVVTAIGLVAQSLAREAEKRERLLAELIATRDQLAASEREAGVLGERTRLAAEIHDTVAQALSSIVMLLHAAEREVGGGAAAAHIRLARETAATGLADARRFVRELTPPEVAEGGLPAALHRLAATHERTHGVPVRVDVPEQLRLPMDAEAALLRVAQGALANVAQHARAGHAGLRVQVEAASVQLTVRDDGVGFDTAVLDGDRRGSFGLALATDRVTKLGGTLTVDSRPGEGTSVRVELPRRGAA